MPAIQANPHGPGVTTSSYESVRPAYEFTLASGSNEPPPNHPELRETWALVLRSLKRDFGSVVSEETVTHFLPVYSPEDEPLLDAHWTTFVAGPSRDPSVDSEELLDLETVVTNPPKRRSTTVYASVSYRGRAKPRPIIDYFD